MCLYLLPGAPDLNCNCSTRHDFIAFHKVVYSGHLAVIVQIMILSSRTVMCLHLTAFTLCMKSAVPTQHAVRTQLHNKLRYQAETAKAPNMKQSTPQGCFTSGSLLSVYP